MGIYLRLQEYNLISGCPHICLTLISSTINWLVPGGKQICQACFNPPPVSHTVLPAEPLPPPRTPKSCSPSCTSSHELNLCFSIPNTDQSHLQDCLSQLEPHVLFSLMSWRAGGIHKSRLSSLFIPWFDPLFRLTVCSQPSIIPFHFNRDAL